MMMLVLLLSLLLLLWIGHRNCFDQWIEGNPYEIPKCPVCRKTFSEPRDMQKTWAQMRYSIARQPLNEEIYRIRVGDQFSTKYGPFVIEEVEQIITSATDSWLTTSQAYHLYVIGQGPLPPNVTIIGPNMAIIGRPPSSLPVPELLPPGAIMSTYGPLPGQHLGQSPYAHQPPLMLQGGPAHGAAVPQQRTPLYASQLLLFVPRGPGLPTQAAELNTFAANWVPPFFDPAFISPPHPQHGLPQVPHHQGPPQQMPHHQGPRQGLPFSSQPLAHPLQQVHPHAHMHVVPPHLVPLGMPQVPHQQAHPQAHPQQAHQQTFQQAHQQGHPHAPGMNMPPPPRTTNGQPPAGQPRPGQPPSHAIPTPIFALDSPRNFLYRGRLVQWELANGKIAKVTMTYLHEMILYYRYYV